MIQILHVRMFEYNALKAFKVCLVLKGLSHKVHLSHILLDIELPALECRVSIYSAQFMTGKFQ